MNHRKLSAGETAGTYRITDTVTEAELLSIARAFARRRLARGRKITQPALAFEYLQVLLQDYEHEVFSALFLDSQHRVIRFEELFRASRPQILNATPDQTGKVLTLCHILNSAPKNVPLSRSASHKA
ncbi:JAB domain-containing protein [Kushneria aurantia]|uniref:JAB domain-containing protein n=1 Tax=Kushneria aurantia TaxID=504092 RepID=A0ABV6G2Q9_9GAMM|nr:JAB domain-containing protein [Kushneria aurantia]